MSASLAPAVPTSTQRRSARLIPADSPQWVVVHALREALSPAWTPDTAADHLLERVGGCEVLRLARLRLRRLGAQRMTVLQARALATLNLAITRREDAYATSTPPSTTT